MIRKNDTKPNKITLTEWVDKVVDLAFTKKISCQGSKVQKFGHLTIGPWIQKLALVFCTHCKIKPRKKKN